MNYGTELWFRSYNLIFDMMKLRGYVPDGNDKITDISKFSDQIFGIWNSPQDERDRYIKFTKPQEVMYVGFYTMQSVNKSIAQNIHAFLDMRLTELNPENEQNPDRIATQIRSIIVARNITKGDAKNQLKQLRARPIPRNEQNPHLAKIKLQVFLLDTLQYNPLEHCLSPKYTLITSKSEQEHLRLRLIRDLTDKNKQLYDLIPLVYTTDIIVKWFGAEVGDVLYSIRKIGGRAPYYRYVTPSLLKEEKWPSP